MPMNSASRESGGVAAFRLFRVDDRLLHGQVSLGWARHLGRTDYVLADQALAEDPDAVELYTPSAPEGSRVCVLTPGELIERLGLKTQDDALTIPEAARPAPAGGRVCAAVGFAPDPARAVLLVRGLEQAGILLRAGVPGPVNLGGLHMRKGATRILPYLYLTPEERELLRGLLAAGRSFYAQQLPGYPRVEGRELLEHPAWGSGS